MIIEYKLKIKNIIAQHFTDNYINIGKFKDYMNNTITSKLTFHEVTIGNK